MSDEVRDVIIIGSGPAGYTAAVYAARASLRPVVFEGSVTAGGALMNTTEVENFPGFPDAIMGPDLMEAMRAQAERFGAELIRDDVTAVSLQGPVKTVTDGEGTTWSARTVILATGSAYRQMGLADEARLSGHGVSWCATCDGFFFRGQDIAVVGGGDSAVEEATFLTKFAASVTIVHRRDELRASAIMAKRARDNPKIRFAWNSAVDAIHGQDKVTGVTLRDTQTEATVLLPVTGVFVAIGHDPRNELFRGVVDLDEQGYVKVQGRTTLTNVAGVFACGDLVDHTYRQAITAAGSGCAAALDAEHYLRDLEHTPEHTPGRLPSKLPSRQAEAPPSSPAPGRPMDSAEWDRRYDGKELVWSAAPNIFVQQLTEDLPAGTALDVAAGEGRNALWLASRGWQVTAVDFSAVALQRARSLAQEQLGPDAGRLATLEADLGTWVPQAGSYDLVLVVYLQVPKQLRSAVMQRAAEAVAPGGTLLVVGHDLANLTSGYGGPQDPTVLYRPVDIVADIEPAQLVIVRDETVTRSLTDDQGQPAEALDALVLARRSVD